MMIDMTETIEQLRENVLEYEKVVREHPEYVYPGRVPDWYYIPALNMVGPSKFIGYAGMTGERYHDGRGLNGGTTETHLASTGWFRDLLPSDPEYAVAERLANRLCPSGHHQRNAKFRILEDEYDNEIRRLNEKAPGRRGDSGTEVNGTKRDQMAGRRKYWVVSPNVNDEEGRVDDWKREIRRRHVAIVGWGPQHKGNGGQGYRFAHKVQRGDIFLAARGRSRADVVGFGVVNGPLEGKQLPPREEAVSLYHLDPFMDCDGMPKNVPVLRILQHTMGFVQKHPESDKGAKRVFDWIEQQLDEAGSGQGEGGSRKGIPARPKLTDIPKFGNRGYEVKTPAAVNEAQRTEADLLSKYLLWLRKHGRQLKALKYSNGTECDAWEIERQNVVEAKGSTSREDIRMAVGQLLDYAFQGRVVCRRPNKAILLPSRPTDERIRWLEPLGIKVIWREKGSFVDNANGGFV